MKSEHERIRREAPGAAMSGGRALAEMLKAHECGPIFGMGGFQLLPFYEASRQLGLRHILVNDERCGAFAADAYARVAGKPGLCDGTLGPGATNLVTGLVESLNAGVPVVAITGDTARAHSWKNMTQECRQTEILRPAVKELIRVEDALRIPEHVRRAFAVATSGRPGPVVLDVPEDIAHAELELAPHELQAEGVSSRYPARRSRPAAEDVERAAALLAKAKRPLILAGGGIHLSQAHEVLACFAQSLCIPVAYTMSGKGALADSHPLSAGLFGRYSRIANELIASSDCLLVVGCKLGEIATMRFKLLPPGATIIHLELLAEEIGRTAQPAVSLWGDAREGLRDLFAALAGGKSGTSSERREYAAEVGRRMAKWREEARPRLESAERPVNMGRMIAEINRAMPEDSILVADGGFAAHWTALLYDAKSAGRTYVANRGLAAIGYGLPGALGAQLAAPGRRVIAITGDGGFNMSAGDLETARRAGAAFILCVVNNAASGYVKALQHSLYGAGRYQSSDLSEIDYGAVARAYGCQGIRVEEPGELPKALAAALENTDIPTVLDVVVTRDPAQMLPGVDSRALKVTKGDRPV
jgi:acetolactate synthase-1/2/3 large subunit